MSFDVWSLMLVCCTPCCRADRCM